MDRDRTAWRLAGSAALVASAAALGGVLFPGVYRDEPIVAAGWRANDLVTLFLAVPLLLAALQRAMRGSMKGRLVLVGALHYLLYNDAFYLFGATLNPLLLVYAVVAALALWALVLTSRAIDLRDVEKTFANPPRRSVALWMGFVALGLTVNWSAQWLVALLRTTPAGRFDLTPEFVRVVAALDLTAMVALLVPGAVLLWRRSPWGVVLAVALNVSGALYNVVLAAGTVAQIRAGLAGAWGLFALWIFLGAGCALAAVSLAGPRLAPLSREEEECRTA